MSKINISTANGRKRNRHYIPSVTLTTSDVGSIQPINVIECMPGDHIDINMSQYSQSQPTAVRTFGSFDLKTYAFFVPAKTVWRHYEDWMVRSADVSIPATEAPNIYLFEILNVLFGIYFNHSVGGYYSKNTDYASFSDVLSVIGNSSSVPDYAADEKEYGSKYDFLFYTTVKFGGDTSYMKRLFGLKLTAAGRLLMKVFRGLGYEIPMRIDLSNYNEGASPLKPHPLLNFKYSAVPLLCFGRIFYDYIYPSAYVQQQGFGEYFDKDSWDFGNDGYLDAFLKLFFVPMSQDFFNSLWLRLNAKAVGNGSPVFPETNVGPSLSNSLKAFSNDNGAGVSQSTASNTLTLSAYGLRWLEDISDYVVRNQIGGTRFHEWMKAHFGWVSSDQDSNRSVFLKDFNSSLNFSQVVANTNTDTQLLGQTAALGQSSGSGRLKFEAKEFGYIIFLHMVVPVTAYYQGNKPFVNAITSQYDFYIPELDSVGMQPVPRHEVFFSYDRMDDLSIADVAQANDVFGFAPRYADRLKRGVSTLNGDFRLSSRNTDLDAYHTFRDVLYGRKNLALDAQFMEADNQYNRVFAYPLTTPSDVKRDHIESFFMFDIKRYSSASSIGDSMPIFNKSGQDVSLENGGTQLK